MVQLIIGSKGKGKTKVLLKKADEALKVAMGTVVYVDKNSQHMYELSNKIRLINVGNYPVNTPEGYIGFLSGIIAQDNDLEYMFLDSFLATSGISAAQLPGAMKVISVLAEKYKVNFVISVSMDSHELPEELKSYDIVEL